jgi:hypothetical protein
MKLLSPLVLQSIDSRADFIGACGSPLDIGLIMNAFARMNRKPEELIAFLGAADLDALFDPAADPDCAAAICNTIWALSVVGLDDPRNIELVRQVNPSAPARAKRAQRRTRAARGHPSFVQRTT